MNPKENIYEDRLEESGGGDCKGREQKHPDVYSPRVFSGTAARKGSLQTGGAPNSRIASARIDAELSAKQAVSL
jgi:hypothetical protein